MTKDKLKLLLLSIGSVIATWIIFKSFFYITSLGYVSIGDSYCEFGPIPAKYASFDIPFKSNYTGQLTLIDKSGKQLSNTDYTVIVDGKTASTCFNAPGKRLVNIKIRGNSSSVAGRTFVRVQGGGPLITHYYFRHHSNPFVYYLIAIITAIIFVLILWFVFLQKLFYPRFKNITKTIFIPNQSPVLIKCAGFRCVILTPNAHKQNIWGKIIKGPINYKVVQSINSCIKLKPTSNGHKILFVADSNAYKCVPNPIDSFNPAIIDDCYNKQKITIN